MKYSRKSNTTRRNLFIEKKANKHLIAAGILQILLGIGSIFALRWLLCEEGSFEGISGETAKSALFEIGYIYAANIFKILAGLLAIFLCRRKSLLTVILGSLLFIVQLWSFFTAGKDIAQILISIVLLAIPYYYLHNAISNYRKK